MEVAGKYLFEANQEREEIDKLWMHTVAVSPFNINVAGCCGVLVRESCSRDKVVVPLFVLTSHLWRLNL